MVFGEVNVGAWSRPLPLIALDLLVPYGISRSGYGLSSDKQPVVLRRVTC